MFKFYWIKNMKLQYTAKQLIKAIFTFEWKNRPNILDIINSEWLKNTLEPKDYNLRSRLKIKRLD
jgi:hypothetical protein